MTSREAARPIERISRTRRRTAILGSVLLVLALGAPAAPLLRAHTVPSPGAPSPARKISWKQLAPNFLHDQKRIWLFPKHLAHGKYWIPTLALTGATAGLIALDPRDDPYFRRTQTFGQFNRVVSSRNAIAGMAVLPASLYALGLARHDSYMQKTVQLSAESVLDSEVLALVIRDVAQRVPPKEIAPQGDFSDSFFRRRKGPFYVGNGGFPSGHAIAAFSIATIFAERYRRHRWVPWVAYGLACLVGFSRLTLQDHFPSDVLTGAALGYTISHFVVLHPR